MLASRLLRRSLLASITLLLGFGLSACDDDHDHKVVYISNGVLIKTPPGGEDFGSLAVFDSVFSGQRIDNGEDADGFDFFVTVPMRVVISVETLDALNPFVELYGPDGSFIIADDNNGIGVDSLIVGVLDPGLYTAVVWASLDGPLAGEYEITILTGTVSGEDFEEVGIGDSVGVIDRFVDDGANEDTYVFTLVEPANVDFLVTVTGGMPDLAIQVIDQRGNEVFFFDPAGLDAPMVLDEVLGRGTYVVVISNPATGMSGGYDFTILAQN